MTNEYLECPHCQSSVGLAAGTGKLQSDALPERFKLRCSHCDRTSEFTKADVKTMKF